MKTAQPEGNSEQRAVAGACIWTIYENQRLGPCCLHALLSSPEKSAVQPRNHATWMAGLFVHDHNDIQVHT